MRALCTSCLPILLVATFLAAPARACEAPPPHLYVSDAELVARSPRIALVEIIGPTGETPPGYPYAETLPELERYTAYLTPFRARVVETLLGAPVDELAVYGDEPFTPEDFLHHAANWEEAQANADEFNAQEITDFNGHLDARFVKIEGYGGADQDTDCLAHQTFVVGARYLVFEGPQHQRGYELIRREDDRWLARVRELIALRAAAADEE